MGTANRWELLIANHLDQSLWLANQKHGALVISCLLYSSLQVHIFAALFTSLNKLSKYAGEKPFSWAKPTYDEISSSNFNLQGQGNDYKTRLPASGTDLKSRKGLFLGPSPIRKALVNEAPVLNSKGSFVVPAQIFFFFLCYDHCQQRSMRDLFPERKSPFSLAVCSARWLSVCVHWEGEFSLFRLFRVFLLFFFCCCCCVKWNEHFVSLVLVSLVCFAAWKLVEHCTNSSLLRPHWSSSSSSAANFLSGSICSFAIRCGKR